MNFSISFFFCFFCFFALWRFMYDYNVELQCGICESLVSSPFWLICQIFWQFWRILDRYKVFLDKIRHKQMVTCHSKSMVKYITNKFYLNIGLKKKLHLVKLSKSNSDIAKYQVCFFLLVEVQSRNLDFRKHLRLRALQRYLTASSH